MQERTFFDTGKARVCPICKAAPVEEKPTSIQTHKGTGFLAGLFQRKKQTDKQSNAVPEWWEEKKGDTLAALVCQYNSQTDQGGKMTWITAILHYMSTKENTAWVPCTPGLSAEDYERLKGVKTGDTFALSSNMALTPDFLIDPFGKLVLPIFSQKAEAPADYASRFSWINLPILPVCRFAKNKPDCNGIVINAFTNRIQIPKKLLGIVLNHPVSQTGPELVSEERLGRGEEDPNGGVRLALDNERLYFLSVRIKDGMVTCYSIDEEAANDSHYLIKPDQAHQLSCIIDKQYQSGDFVENLKMFLAEKGFGRLESLMRENNIRFQEFHY